MARKIDHTRFASVLQAFKYYQSSGGLICRAAFYKEVIPNQDRSVMRASVDKLLETERKKASTPTRAETIEQRDEAELRKVIAEANIKQLQERQMEREQDKHWLHRDTAEEQMAAIFGQLVAALHHGLQKSIPAMLAACNGDVQRSTELYEVGEGIIIKACNDVAQSGKIDTMLVRG